MADQTPRPVLNPVLKFTKEPRPESATGGGKNAASIKTLRLPDQRKKLAAGFREMASFEDDQPSFDGKVVVYASMFDDSLAPSWTPKDLFAPERGTRLMAPFRSGYLVEVERRSLSILASAAEGASRIADMVDISRVENVRFFDEEDAAGFLSLDEAWLAAPKLKGGRGFLVWFMPLQGQSASEVLMKRVLKLRDRGLAPAPSQLTDMQSASEPISTAFQRALRVAQDTDRLNAAMRLYRKEHKASTTLVVPTREVLTQLVASGAVFRLEPVRAIGSTAPGEGSEPQRPLPSEISAMPVVGVVDGGLTAASYHGAEAWRAPPFIKDGQNDYVHGNRVTSLVVQGHDWNNNLKLPELYCQVGTVQAVPKKDASIFVSPEEFVSYLDIVMANYPNTKVWNFSLNERGGCDPENVSYLGHQIALLARKHEILPIISIGNKPGTILQPPADCEAALTTGGRLHNKVGAPAGACPVSLVGPGPSNMLKPEMSHFSHVRVIGGHQTNGSSYSAALTSPLAAHTMARLREPSPDLAKALMLHRSADGGFDAATGFGSPNEVLPWETPKGAVTLQWSAELRPGAQYYWELPIPASLIKSGKLKGNGRLTAILNPHPMASDFAGPNYFGARLEVALQYERGDKFHNLLGGLDTGKLTEEQARTLDHKWSPIRHHSKPFRSVSYDGDDLRVYARVYTRDLYLHGYSSNEEIPPLEAVFVLTLDSGNEQDDVFTDVMTELGAFVEVSTVDISVDVDNIL